VKQGHQGGGEAVFDAALDSADIELRQFMQEVVRGIRYEDFRELRIEAFRDMRSLVTMDRFSIKSEDDKAERLEATSDHLFFLRMEPDYFAMESALEQAWQEAVRVMSLSDVVSDDRMKNARARRLQRIATLAKDPKANMKAMEMLAERELPTKIPDKGPDVKIIMIQGGHANLLDTTADAEILEASEQRQLVDVTPRE